MVPIIVLIGTSMLLFLVLVMLVVVLAFQSLKEPVFRRPVREDLRKIKAQIEGDRFV